MSNYNFPFPEPPWPNKETDMAQTEPQFKPGDRFWTHYDYRWGTVIKEHHTVRDAVHGVTGSKLRDTTWYDVQYDGDDRVSSMLDDAHGLWDLARMVPPHIAKRFGYGDDPRPFHVKPHTAPMTGAAWFIVVDGNNSQVADTPYYDDYDDAKHVADELNDKQGA